MKKNYNSCHVIRIEYNNQEQSINLENKVYSIGRSRKNSIVIDHFKVSREHCVILPFIDQFEDNEITYYIVDGNRQGKQSSNGLFVDLKQWTRRHQLRTGDVVGIGTKDVVLSYYKFSFHKDKCCQAQPNHQPTFNRELASKQRGFLDSGKIALGKDFILLDG